MSKRIIVKLAVMVAALSTMALLQGCEEEESSYVLSAAWLPVGSVLPYGNPFGVDQVTQGSSGNQVLLEVPQ
jgi:hypothetical protein